MFVMSRWIAIGVALVTSACMPSFALAKEVRAEHIQLADKVQLDTALGQPFVLAGQRQTTFLKVGLTGFKLSEKERTPVNIAIVLDKSSSMGGAKIVEAKRAAIMAVNSLDERDTVSVIAYDSGVRVVWPATYVTDKDAIAGAISQLQAGGSTALFAGVSKGASELHTYLDGNRVNRIILLSDGQANIGPSSPGELAVLGASLAKEGISVTTLGLGLGYNEDLMMQLALASDGNHAFVENATELAKIFKYEFGDVLSVVAQDVDVHIELDDGIRPVRVLGRDAVIDGNHLTARLNQLYSGHQKYLLVEVEVPPTSAGAKRGVARVNIAYNNMATQKKDRLSRRVSLQSTTSAAQVAKSTNKAVMVSATELLANRNTKLAIALRDQGKTQEAAELLRRNVQYLQEQQKQYRSKRLEKMEMLNVESEKNLQPQRWNRTRKSLQDDVFEAETQQSY